MNEYEEILQETEELRKTNNARPVPKLTDWFGFVLKELSSGRVGKFVHSIPVNAVKAEFPPNGKRVGDLIRKCYDALFDMWIKKQIPAEMLACRINRADREINLRYVGQFMPKKMGSIFSVSYSTDWESMSKLILREAKFAAISKLVPAVKVYVAVPNLYTHVITYMSTDSEFAKAATDSISMDLIRSKLVSFPEIKDRAEKERINRNGAGYLFSDYEEIGVCEGKLYYKEILNPFDFTVYDLSELGTDREDKPVYRSIARLLSKVIEKDIRTAFEREKYAYKDEWVLER